MILLSTLCLFLTMHHSVNAMEVNAPLLITQISNSTPSNFHASLLKSYIEKTFTYNSANRTIIFNDACRNDRTYEISPPTALNYLIDLNYRYKKLAENRDTAAIQQGLYNIFFYNYFNDYDLPINSFELERQLTLLVNAKNLPSNAQELVNHDIAVLRGIKSIVHHCASLTSMPEDISYCLLWSKIVAHREAIKYAFRTNSSSLEELVLKPTTFSELAHEYWQM